MRGNVVTLNDMVKKNSLYGKGEKPLTFKQAIKLAGNTPHLTHKQIDELRRKEKLKKQNLKK
jgi:hypothetical protein